MTEEEKNEREHILKKIKEFKKKKANLMKKEDYFLSKTRKNDAFRIVSLQLERYEMKLEALDSGKKPLAVFSKINSTISKIKNR